jgi:photosystem II stability/assembly factor-like uncharacterized protein
MKIYSSNEAPDMNLTISPGRLICPTVTRFIIVFLFLILFLPMRGASSLTREGRPQEGINWRPQKSGVLSRLSGVFFIDPQRGWAVGSNGTLIATEDGGRVWRKRTLPERQKKELVRDVWSFKGEGDASDPRLCLLGEYGIVSPKGVYNITERVFVLISSDNEEGWVKGETARRPSRRPDKILGRISVDDAGRIQVSDPTVYEETQRDPEQILLRMFFVNDRVGWACGESGTIQTTQDGGATWKLQYSLARKLLYDVAAVDKAQAWIVGAGGVVLHTADGGQSWVEQSSGVTEALRAAHFIDGRRGWAVGANGVILATNDGGSRWERRKSVSARNFNDVFFVNGKEGWIAGDEGTLLHTRDGGETWEDDSQETHADLTRLFFVAPDCGWVVGTNGVVFKYGPQE